MAAVLSLLFLTLSIGAVSYFLNVSATRENEVAFRESRHIVESAFSLVKRDLSNWTKDYAWWDDTLDRATGDVDIAWAEDNIGKYLQDAFNVSGSFVVSPELETRFYSPRDEDAKTDALQFLGPKGALFLHRVQATKMGTSIPHTSYARSGNDLYAISAAPITAEHPTEEQMVPHPRPLLILYKKLDDAVIDEIAEQFLLRDLRVTVAPPNGASACIPLEDENGDTIAFISWSPAKPGDHLFAELLPKISFVSIMLFTTALMIFFAWWRTASQANAEKSRFLAKMSHELRTPLNPIVGFSNMMTNEVLGPIPNTYKGYAADIHQCGLHLSAIIEDILDVSRIEAGEMMLHETEFEVSDLIENLPAFSSRVPDLDMSVPRTMSIRHEIEDGLPKLKADRLRVQQVLLNILSNAIKFSDGAEIVVRARRVDRQILIDVEDQGVGISEDDLELLFQPFVQVGAQSIENRSHGSGLGLIVSRELMRLHDGDLTLKSKLDVGTTATMHFPANRSV